MEYEIKDTDSVRRLNQFALRLSVPFDFKTQKDVLRNVRFKLIENIGRLLKPRLAMNTSLVQITAI